MNGPLLEPKKKDGESSFSLTFTRPSPLPPKEGKLGALEVCHLHHPQGNVFPEAESYFCSMVWGVSGQFSIYVNGVRHKLCAGQFAFIGPGCTLHVEADAADNEAYYLLLDGDQCYEVEASSGIWNGISPYSRQPITWLEFIAKNIRNLQKQETLASIGYTLLMTAVQDAAQHAPDRVVWKACCYLQKNWNQKHLNVKQLLEYLEVSRSTLSPRFKKVTGKSTLEYLVDIRYEKSLHMLLHEYASVATIAQKCGFVDVSYFSTWFKKMNGQPPRDVKMKTNS